MKVDLARYDNGEYHPGRSLLIRVLWFLLGAPLLRWSLLPFSRMRVTLLRLFGASIGDGVVIKPGVRVKFPWRLSVGEQSWIGEDAWIDNIFDVTVGANVCVSQGVYICAGNHDWTDPTFGLRSGPVSIHQSAWLCGK